MAQPTWKPAHASSASWTIKGVDEATREAVREAAARADMLIGEWVDQALRAAVRETLQPSPPAATKADIAALLDELKALKATVREPAPPAPPPSTKAEMAAVLDELAGLRATVQGIAQALVQRGERHERPQVRHVLVEQKPKRMPLARGVIAREP